ncbi:MAG: hypothetical protein OEW42_13810 [Acidimicrobiia bacterium]|nr:hypothetical protein [Acidimicrobiia bacterium]
MSYRLAVEVGGELVRAAVVEDRNVRWVSLADGDGLPSAVHHGEDGTILVGAEALAAVDRPGRLDPDPTSSLGVSDDATAGVAALLAAAQRSVAEQRGEPPELVMIAHPDDWPAAKTRALTEAARAGGLPSFERASAGAAVDAYRKVSGNVDRTPRAVAYGAAILAADAASLDNTAALPVAGAAAAAALITLEDIAGPLPEPPDRPTPTFASDGPASVFEDPQPASPPTQALPVVPPPPPPGPPPSEPPPEDGNSPWSRWAVVLGVLAVVLALALILVLLNNDGDDNEVSTQSSTSTTSTVSTTVPTSSTTTSTTTTVPTTTSTTSTTTTTTTTTTSTTTTEAPATTQAPAPEVAVEPGEIVVDPEGSPVAIAMGADGLGAVATISGALGPPDSDSGFVAQDGCDTDSVRRVRWGDLELVLLDDPTQSVGQWVLAGSDGEVRTGAGIAPGSTVAELQAAYTDVDLRPAGSGLTEFIFTVTEPGGTIVGITSGGSGFDRIEQMWSGDGCRPLFAL